MSSIPFAVEPIVIGAVAAVLGFVSVAITLYLARQPDVKQRLQERRATEKGPHGEPTSRPGSEDAGT